MHGLRKRLICFPEMRRVFGVAMEGEVQSFIRKHKLLAAGEGVLIAVSGGPDSVALLHVLDGIREQLNLRLEIAHLQHGIRGAQAAEDARFVGCLAEKLKLPFHEKELNLPRLQSEAGRGNLEELAREERYKFFAGVAAGRGLGKIATAHTQDDQAETVLMWLLRGSGMTGLGGMAPVRRLPPAEPGPAEELVVIRPFLETSKSEILQYLAERQIPYRRDATNSDPSLLRNWIRQELLPVMKGKAGGHLPARLARQAELLRDENDYMDGLARGDLQAIRAGDGLKRREFLRRHPAMQRRILRLWVAETRGNLHAVDYRHIESMLELILSGPPQGRFSIPGGWELVAEYDIVRLGRRCRDEKRGAPCRYSYELRIGVPLNVAEAGMAIMSEYGEPPLDAFPETLTEAVFDAAALPDPLTVRNFRHGDRLRPLGLAGHKKLKDLFIENKVPRSLRARLPLLVGGGDILWVPGYGRSDLGTIGAQTRKIARFKAVSLAPRCETLY
jgi:tRNA(Ile)-lysidine synthase